MKKMKWPTMDEFAQMVAEKALDEYEYKGKTLREWVEIISATDTNVGSNDAVELPDLVQEALKKLSEKELKKMEHCGAKMEGAAE